MKKLLSKIESLDDRKEKIMLIDTHVEREGLSPDILPLMAKAKYLPENAVNALILQVSDEKAVEAIEVLKENDYVPDKQLLIDLVEKSLNKAAAAVIKLFKMTFTKSELMSIANKGGAEAIVTAITLSKDLDYESIQTLIGVSVEYDLERIYNLIEIVNDHDKTSDDKIISFARDYLSQMASIGISNDLRISEKEGDLESTKATLKRLDEFNKRNPDWQLTAHISESKTGRNDSTEEAVESAKMFTEFFKDKDVTETQFYFALRTATLSNITLSESIFKNLVRFDEVHQISSFRVYEIGVNLLEKILKTKIHSHSKSAILNEVNISESDKIELAVRFNILADFYRTVMSKKGSKRRQNDDIDSYGCKIILSSGDLFKQMISSVKITSKMATKIYNSLGDVDRKERLEVLLSLESEITKDIRSRLSDADKKLLSETSVKTDIISKKRTWFPEALKAITNGNLDEFRSFITSDYNLEKFLSDSKTQTNKERLGRARTELCQNTWLNLTNTEFKTLKEIGFRFDDDISSHRGAKCSRTWSESDMKILSKELIVVCVAHTKDPESLIQFISKNKGLIRNGGYYLNRFEDIVEFAYKIENNRYNKGKASKELVSKFNHAFDVIAPDASMLETETLQIIISGRSKVEALKLLTPNIKEYSLSEYMSFKCKDGLVFTVKDELPLDKVIIKEVDKSYSFLREMKDLRELGLNKVAKAIGMAYISKNYKEELAKLKLKAPDRRKDVQEIMEQLGVEVVTEDAKPLNLRGMKTIVRESNAEVINQIIEKFKPDEIKAAIVKSWGVKDDVLMVSFEELNPKRLVHLDKLLSVSGLSCILTGNVGDRSYISSELASFIQNLSGLENIKFKELPLQLKYRGHGYGEKSFDIEPSMAETFNIDIGRLSSVISSYRKDFISKLDEYHLVGEGCDLLNAMAPNDIISKLCSENAIYILGEKGMLTRKIFIQIQDRKIKFNEISDQVLLAEYVSGKIGCRIDEVPFLYSDDKLDGIKSLDDRESVMLTAKISIDEFVKGDRPIQIRDLNPKDKLELINYAMKAWNMSEQIDPSQLNLEEIDSLDNWMIESFKNLETKSLSKIFGFKESDKKLVQRVRDVLAIRGLDIVRRAIIMRELWKLVIKDDSKITLDDTLGSDDSKPFCDEYKKKISEFLSALNSYPIGANFLLSSPVSAGKLRDWIKTGNNFKDTLDIIEKNVITNKSIKNTSAKDIGISDEEYEILKNRSENSITSLNTVIKNSDFEMIHDIAVKLTNVSDKDMLIVENQDHYTKLEGSDVSEKLGYSLFFPKTYADTHMLGSQNGWCVCSTQTYSEKVREGRAILVGIAPIGEYTDRDKQIEACEALLYVLFNRKEEVESSQIMYSNMMSKDFSKKMPLGSSRKETVGRQEAPSEKKYPAQEIISLAQRVRRQNRIGEKD